MEDEIGMATEDDIPDLDVRLLEEESRSFLRDSYTDIEIIKLNPGMWNHTLF